MKFVRMSALSALLSCSIAAWSQQSTPATAPAGASAQTTAAAAQGDAEDTLKQRATAYYTAVTRGDRNAAQEFLAPELRDQFDISRFRALSSFSVDKVVVDPSGDKADVTVTRSFGGQFAMSIPWHDQWVNAGGQWFLLLPKNNGDSPFGNFGPPTANSTPKDPKAEAEAMKAIGERKARTADPDQYLMQLDKYVKEHPDSLPPSGTAQVSGSQVPLSTAPSAKSGPSKTDKAHDQNKTKKDKKKKTTPKTSDQAAAPTSKS